MTKRRGRVFYIISAILVVSCVGLFMYNYYVFFVNETNHSGIEVSKLQAAYTLQAALSILLIRFVKNRAIVLCVIVGVLGAVEIFLLDRFGVMSFYDDWLKRGLESRIYGCWFLDCQ